MSNNIPKIIFGFIIFAFSIALAYFVADYAQSTKAFDYWGALASFAFIYVVVGIMIRSIFPISLGFLFSADILILNLLINYYGKWTVETKLLIIGVILVALYSITYVTFRENDSE